MINSSTEAQMTQNPCYVQCGDNLELLKSQPNESVNTSVLNNWTMLYENLELSNGFKINIKPVLFSDSIEIMQLKLKLS